MSIWYFEQMLAFKENLTKEKKVGCLLSDKKIIVNHILFCKLHVFSRSFKNCVSVYFKTTESVTQKIKYMHINNGSCYSCNYSCASYSKGVSFFIFKKLFKYFLIMINHFCIFHQIIHMYLYFVFKCCINNLTSEEINGRLI